MAAPATFGADLNFSDSTDLANRYLREAQQKVRDHEKSAMQGFHPLPTGSGIMEEDDTEPSNRGEEYTDLVSCFTSPLLRFGFLGQLISLIFVYAIYYGQGGTGIFSFDLFNLPESLRTSESFSIALLALQSVYLTSCIMIAGFQAFVVDNSKLSRGFRAGSKILGGAVTLDIVVVALRLLQYVYAYHFLGSKWWLKYAQTKSDWCLFYAGAGINGVTLIMYGLAIFYMETYHDEGTIEEIGWVTLSLFGAAGTCEILMAVTGFGTFYTVFQIAAVVSATIWAFSFEPLLHYHAPALHNRDINDGILPMDDGDDDEDVYE